MQNIEVYRAAFVAYLNEKTKTKNPKNLYEPITYILNLGGKRLRPILTLMSAEIFGGTYQKALDAALAIEVFHNFSLVHDDIMDNAPLRRGKTTVHEKWDVNTGILSGDAMLINAYQLLERYPADTFKDLAKVFSKTAIEVCEGQQYDVDFETRDDVSFSDYLAMISFKTAVLVAAAMQMGAIIAKASAEDQKLIYAFGLNLGIAFQLQDDYLDAFGNPKTFGKQVGGDIIANKKTVLYLEALSMASKEEQLQLKHLYSIQPKEPTEKINTVKIIFKSSGSADFTIKEIERYTEKAFTVLNALGIDEDKKMLLRNFGTALMKRNV